MPAEYPFVLVVDEQNDFAFYYSGTMDQDAMSKSLINLEYVTLLNNICVHLTLLIGVS